jgi:hypothetical protein
MIVGHKKWGVGITRFLLGLIFIFSFAARAGIEIPYDEYVVIRDVSLSLDSQGGFILAIGRAPTPFARFLENLRPNAVATLPVSEFQYALTSFPVISGLYNEPMPPNKKSILFEMLRERIPRKEILGTRTVFVMDLTNSWMSLAGVSGYAMEFFLQENYQAQIEVVPLSSRDPADVRRRGLSLGFKHVTAVKLPASLEAKLQNNLDYVGLAKHVKNSAALRFNRIPATESSEGYRLLGEEFEKIMSADPVVISYRRQHGLIRALDQCQSIFPKTQSHFQFREPEK